MSKKCIKCQNVKPASEFHKNSRNKDGLYSYCTSCSKSWYLANKNRLSKLKSKRYKDRYSSDVEFRLRQNSRHRLNLAIKNNQKKGSAVSDLGCSIFELITHIESQFHKHPSGLTMSWDNWGRGKNKWQIDHIIPLSSVDITDRDVFLKVVHYSNLQPMWWDEHAAKDGKIRAGVLTCR